MGSEKDDNSLTIEGAGFSMTLRGDAAFINATYNAVRKDLLARFAASLTAQKAPAASAAAAAPAPMPTVEGMTFRQVSPSASYVWVCVCHDFYHKIHILGRSELGRSPLVRAVDPRRLFRVYIEREHRETLEALVGSGRELWSELTGEGQKRLGGSP